MHQGFPLPTSSTVNNIVTNKKQQQLQELERTMQYLAISNNNNNKNGAGIIVLEQQEASSSSSASSSSANSSCENGLDGIGIMDTIEHGHHMQKQQTSPTKRNKAQMKKSLHLDLLSISNSYNSANNNSNAGFLSPASATAAERLNSGILSPWNQPRFQHRRMRPSKLFPVNIMPYLYLGNDETAKNRETLSNCGIHYVINVTSDLPNYFEEQWQQENQQQDSNSSINKVNGDNDNIVYMRIPVDDNCSHNLAQFFPKAIAFIEQARSQHVGVLVHCWAGISRSVTICLAYLMYSLHCSLEEAFDRLLKQNGTIAPNFHFMEALTCWERELLASSFSSSAMGIRLAASASPTPLTTANASSNNCNSNNKTGQPHPPH